MAWQHPHSRKIHPVGVLEQAFDGSYAFAYLRRARDVEGFRPFLGFPDLTRRYESSALFPLFAQRVMDSRRPDYETYMHTLGLPEDAAPMEVLARSGGHRSGDTIQLVPEPLVETDGTTWCRFLVHGIRHRPGAGERITALRAGDELALRDEPDNPKNSRAVLVAANDEQPLGWVPDLLLDYVHHVRARSEPLVRVEQANGENVPPHLRLLVSLSGTVAPGYRPFTGPGWETLA